MTICEQYYCAVYLYTISSVAISLLKLSLFLYIMDQSDLVLRLHGAVQANETLSHDIQPGEPGPGYKDMGLCIKTFKLEN